MTAQTFTLLHYRDKQFNVYRFKLICNGRTVVDTANDTNVRALRGWLRDYTNLAVAAARRDGSYFLVIR